MSPVPTKPEWWWRSAFRDELPPRFVLRLRDDGAARFQRDRDCSSLMVANGRWPAPSASLDDGAEVDRLRSLVATLERAAGGGGE